MTHDELTHDQIRAIALEALTKVAPDLAGEPIPDDADLRDAYDLDSMDFLNWLTALHRRLGVDIPELDYPKLSNLGAATEYLAARLQGS